MKKPAIKLKKKGSVIGKIIIYYSAALLILCIINITFCVIVRDTLFDKEISKGEEYLRYLSVIMDQKITEVHNLSYSFLTNIDNTERMSNVNSIENRYRLSSELKRIAVSVGVADRIFLYNSDRNTVCSDDGVYSAENYMCQTYGWSGEANAKLNETLRTDKGFCLMPAKMFTGAEDEDCPFSMIIATSVIAVDKAFRLVIPINNESYAKIAVNDINNIGTVCIVNDSGGVLFSSQNDSSVGGVINTIRNSSSKRGFEISGDNIVLWDASNYFRGNYIKVIPKSIVNRSVRGISICIFAECAMLILFGFIVAPYFIRQSYMPMYNILWHYKNLFGDELEVKNEYTYIVDGLGRIKNELNEYNGTTLLFNFLQNGYYCDEIGSLFEREFFVVAIVKMRDKRLLDEISAYIETSSENVRIIGMSGYKYAVIMNDDTPDLEAYRRWFEMMVKYVGERTGERILTAMSDVLPGSEKINLLYRRADIAYNNGCCAEVGGVFVYTDGEAGKRVQLYYPENTEESIIYAVKNGMREDVKKLIEEIFDKNRNINYSMLEVLNMRLLSLYFKLSHAGGESFFGMMTAFFDREYEPDRIRDRFIEIFLCLVYDAQTPEEPTARLQDFLIDFIDENYSSPSLNIDVIAERLGLSVPYTSRMFKQAMGQTFKEYLLNKRIEEAKRLITTTNFSIKEISEKVGAGTYNSFVRMFKNKVGVSPGQYRSMDKQL